MKKKLEPIPRKIRCGVGEDEDFNAQEAIENFFQETQNYLEEKFGRSPHFERCFNNCEQSDKRVTYLIYQDQLVAGVFEWRTEANHKEYVFFHLQTTC